MKSFKRQFIEKYLVVERRARAERELLEAIEKDDGVEFKKHNEIVVLLRDILAELKDMNNPAN